MSLMNFASKADVVRTSPCSDPTFKLPFAWARISSRGPYWTCSSIGGSRPEATAGVIRPLDLVRPNPGKQLDQSFCGGTAPSALSQH